MNNNVVKRDPYWDSLKFVLVFFVVVYHCMGSYSPVGGINQAVFNLLLTFLMPTFIFVSGMFSHMKDKEKYKKGILLLFETFAVFQLIRALPPMIIEGDFTLRAIASVIGGPRYTLWYLMSLITWRLIVYFMPEKFLRDNPILIISACIFISLLGGFIPVSAEFSLQRTMTYLPFFFMGYYAKNIELKKYIAKIPPLLAVAVLVCAFLVIFNYFNINLRFVLLGKFPYWGNAEYSPVMLCLARFISLSAGVLTGLSVMRLVMVKPAFPEWGKITLFIYIYHSFLIQASRFAASHGYLPQNEWIWHVIAVIITGVLICLSKVKFFNILLNPVSYIIGRNGTK